MSRNWILGVLVAAATFGCATTQNPAVADSRTASNSPDKSAAGPYCVRDTGTYIKRKDDAPCRNQAGRSYSQQELESTGKLSTADALRQVDPTIQ